MVKGKLVMNIHFSHCVPTERSYFMVILFYTPIVPTERKICKRKIQKIALSFLAMAVKTNPLPQNSIF